jgi:hypothetical protein
MDGGRRCRDELAVLAQCSSGDLTGLLLGRLTRAAGRPPDTSGAKTEPGCGPSESALRWRETRSMHGCRSVHFKEVARHFNRGGYAD